MSNRFDRIKHTSCSTRSWSVYQQVVREKRKFTYYGEFFSSYSMTIVCAILSISSDDARKAGLQNKLLINILDFPVLSSFLSSPVSVKHFFEWKYFIWVSMENFKKVYWLCSLKFNLLCQFQVDISLFHS